MNDAFDASRAVVAMQKDLYFLKAGGYIVSSALIPDAVRTSFSVFLDSEHHANMRYMTVRHANILEYYSRETSSNNAVLGSLDVVSGHVSLKDRDTDFLALQIVYCDLSRYVTRTKKNRQGQTVFTHVDTDLQVEWTEDRNWVGCSGIGVPFAIAAVTINYAPVRLAQPDVIQICPWYLNWVISQKFKDSNEVKPSWLVRIHPEAQKALDRYQKTKMDLRTGSLLSHKLSHELTHTSNAGASKDFPGAGLAWEDCVGLASVGNQNAETLAQLGATAVLIQDENLMPNLAGDIVPLSLDD